MEDKTFELEESPELAYDGEINDPEFKDFIMKE